MKQNTRPVRKHYSHFLTNEAKANKRLESENRQKTRSLLSELQQIEVILKRRGNSQKEVDRLTKLLEAKMQRMKKDERKRTENTLQKIRCR